MSLVGGVGGGGGESVVTTEGISILINEMGVGGWGQHKVFQYYQGVGTVTTEGISKRINESEDGCHDNIRYFKTN